MAHPSHTPSHIRTAHPFPTIRSKAHLVTMAVLIFIPFLALLAFSYVSKIQVTVLFTAMTISLARLALAFVISVVVGWICAVNFYRGRRAQWSLPIFDILQSFPIYAALPLAVFYWGSTSFVVIFFLTLNIVWAIFFTVNSSLRLVRSDWVEAVRISRISRWDYLRLYLIPVTIPALVTGSIIGLGSGWQALVATEIIANIKNGLGPFFSAFSNNTTVTAFGILAILSIIFVINKLIWLPLLERSHVMMEE